MKLNRGSYVVFYQGKHVLRKLETLNVNLIYVSKKQHYAVLYMDNDNENEVKRELKKVKGFRGFNKSLNFDENYNF